ncbi:polysaccharide deacetylase family protein [Anaerotignum sp. MB30-C6]|uniref:polysaccharide deacetylase family protein n=1 Tax=Anaerotignum sp. MB30-C6 TaxID=3070814 RepID=UPI0027DAC7D7|nr:polysaccharide deacetylase family protein [Anaerotignum sp. MB30-C6]WMI82253.1 polysaccharide deacetylase family protein [Anaerotignum sp. MB30-C6]
MKLFKAIHIRKKHLLGALALVACIGVFTCLAPPAAEKVSAIISANADRKLPIYCVDTDKPQVSVSFDAAWGADDTDELLSILADNDVKATFFLCGYWVEDFPVEVKKIADAGHDLGNHSSTHPHMNQLSAEQISKELAECHKAVKDLTGIEMDLFRPPFGEYNNTVVETSYANSYYPVQWDVDSLDWKELGEDHEINQVLNHKHLGNGSIILFHNDAKYTPKVLDRILKGLKEKGFEIVPISQLIHRDNFEMDHEGRQRLSTPSS